MDMVLKVQHVLETMNQGQESEHLQRLLRHVHHTGTDIRLTNKGPEFTGDRPVAYPAFRWLWREVTSYKWKVPNHINILELHAYFNEIRRRARIPDEHHKRFFNVVDSLVTFYIMGKGRSSSVRLNRVA